MSSVERGGAGENYPTGELDPCGEAQGARREPMPVAPAVAVVAVVVVSVVAAVVSYAHMRAVAHVAGEGWRAEILPLSVDGLLVAASLVLLLRRRAGRAAGGLVWTSMLLGVGASLAANVAAAEPTVLGRVVAAWPPLAFFLTFELLVQVLRERPAVGEIQTPGGRGVAQLRVVAAPGHPQPGDEPPVALPGRVAELAAAGAGRRRIARELGMSEHQARLLLAAQRTGSSRGAPRVGAH